MRCGFIEAHRGRWPVRLQCETLDVSPAAYYAWRRRGRGGGRPQRAEPLLAEVQKIHREKKETYGSPRMHAELVSRGHRCCENTVAKLMKKQGIHAKTRRKFRVTTDSKHGLPVAPNRLEQWFETKRANQVWLGDITYVWTDEGWLYLSAVEDLHTRKIVGWSMAERLTSRLTVDALTMAIERQLPATGLLTHTDRGSQYASDHYQRLLAEHGMECSMSRRGNCYDNAPMESFFATLKKELVYHERYATREAARQSLFEYIEVFYNRERRHSALGYRTPTEFEQAA